MDANFVLQLKISTLTGNSGIYVGNQNIVNGISSHSKRNSGFGSIGAYNHLTRNFCVVYDPDAIDTPIDDRDVHVYAPRFEGEPNVINARVDTIQVETLQQNAGVFIGDTTITGFDAHEKENIGVGNFFGSQNVTEGNVVITYDPDTYDALMDDRDIKSGVFINPSGPVTVQGH